MTTDKTYTCDFDCWTETKRARNWLHENHATELKRAWGFTFYENPIYGDEAPVLAVLDGGGPASPVYNTQDFDLPVRDPKEAW